MYFIQDEYIFPDISKSHIKTILTCRNISFMHILAKDIEYEEVSISNMPYVLCTAYICRLFSIIKYQYR